MFISVPNLSDHGPGAQISVTLNSILQCRGSFIRFYSNRTKKIKTPFKHIDGYTKEMVPARWGNSIGLRCSLMIFLASGLVGASSLLSLTDLKRFFFFKKKSICHWMLVPTQVDKEWLFQGQKLSQDKVPNL